MPYIDTKNYNIYYDIQDIRIKAPLFEVDEMIAPIISLLNKKGYKTKYCCSGHLNEVIYKDSSTPHNDCYIMFANKNKFKNIKMPENFVVEYEGYDDKKSLLIYKLYESEQEFERYIEIYETMKSLYEWVVKLP